MKKTSITISFDEEKLSALKMYLTQRGVQVESELERSLETLYTKSGNTPKPAPAVKKPKPSPSSAVGAGGQEVQNG